MRAVELIAKKRDGAALTSDEIRWLIHAFTNESIPDYQMAALLMAIYLRGMDRRETVDLTLAMAASGEQLDLSSIADYWVDKHSSGGVGDKTTLVVLPLVAACGVPVAKMSGRGLGFSGGTLDKLESIAGFNVNLSADEFKRIAREHGIVLAGQSMALAPADGKLYALRDVTATVESLPLIASSIMSKKIAAGANAIVLDVKVGVGAFMQTREQGAALARTMVEIGIDAGREVIAVLSDMNQPLGEAVGNALEVVEAIDVLNGAGPADLRVHCLEIAGHMLRLAGHGEQWADSDEVQITLARKLEDGSALAKFREMVEAQGGDVRMVDDPLLLPQAAIKETVNAPRNGYVHAVAADQVAWAAFELGAGRETKGAAIDLAVGVEVHINVGDEVTEGTPIATIHANDSTHVPACRARLERALRIDETPIEPLPLFYDVISSLDRVDRQ